MGKQDKSIAEGAFERFKYGMPVYGLAWPTADTFYLCGGGGSVAAGIRNRVIAAQRTHGMLTDQVAEFDFGKNCPMKLAIHPNGRHIALAMAQGGLKRIDIDDKGKAPKLTEVTGDLATKLSSDKTEYKALAFDVKGNHILLGGVDGTLKVLRWPTMEERLVLKGDARLPDGIRDIGGAPRSASRLAVVLDNGTAQIWDWELKQAVCVIGQPTGSLKTDAMLMMKGPTTTSIQALPKGLRGVRFASLKYAPANPDTSSNSNQGSSNTNHPTVLYALMNNRQGCWLVIWHQDSATGMLRIHKHKHLGEDPASCLDVSSDGQLLTVGTSAPTILVLRADNLAIVKTRPKAHTVFCTGVAFSPDTQHVLSVSGDASAILTSSAEPPKKSTPLTKMLFMTILLAALLLSVFVLVVKVLTDMGRHDIVWNIHTALASLGVLKQPEPLQYYKNWQIQDGKR